MKISEKMYRIIADIDLSRYLTEGKSWLYNTIKSLHKPAYEDDERIIFRLNQPDIKKYEGGKGEIESALDEYLAILDISEYFVIKEFKNDPIEQLGNPRDAICILPWIHLYADPTGSIAPCCIGEKILGNISNYPTVDEAINSPEYKSLRKSMIEGKKHIACQNCYERESIGNISPRLGANDTWREYAHLIDKTNDDGSIDNFQLRYYDIRLNNTCNFKCRTCGGNLSSSIASEEVALGQPKQITIKDSREYDIFMGSILRRIDEIESIYFAGGEPLLMEEHYQILNLLLEKNRTDVSIRYNTNFSNLKFKKKSIIDIWKKFSDVSLGISLDAMGRKAEYLRHGTRWDQILENINLVRRECGHLKLMITSTWSIYNALHLPDFHLWLLDNNIVEADCLFVESAYGDLNSLHLLPIGLRLKAKDKALAVIERLKLCSNSKIAVNGWTKCINHLMSEDKSFQLDKFKERVKELDRIRNENFLEIFPEMAELF